MSMDLLEREPSIVSPRLRRAFLPDKDPILTLPEQYWMWDHMGAELPHLLAAGQARRVLTKMILLDPKDLHTNEEKERALGLLSAFGHASVHESWRQGSAMVVPLCIAKPWAALAKSMGRFPVLTYASHGLNNWRKIDSKGVIELGNIAVLRNFFGGLDENWFVAVHVEIEACAAPLVDAIVAAHLAIEEDIPENLLGALEIVADTLEQMSAVLGRVRENCDPHIFFNRVQPFMQGMKGVIYEGVEEFGGLPQNYAGGSGAQSTLLPLMDAALGVKHAEDALLAYLVELRRYMPGEHQIFLSGIEKGPSIRNYLLRYFESDLVAKYNRCIDGLGKFRAQHLEMSIEYIQRPAMAQRSGRGEHGTGGSPFVGYLKKHREETFSHRLK